jgi:hypothetical protein
VELNKFSVVDFQGRETFKFETNLTEVIRGVYVEGSMIYTAGEYGTNQYEFKEKYCQDKYYYLSSGNSFSRSPFPR